MKQLITSIFLVLAMLLQPLIAVAAQAEKSNQGQLSADMAVIADAEPPACHDQGDAGDAENPPGTSEGPLDLGSSSNHSDEDCCLTDCQCLAGGCSSITTPDLAVSWLSGVGDPGIAPQHLLTQPGVSLLLRPPIPA